MRAWIVFLCIVYLSQPGILLAKGDPYIGGLRNVRGKGMIERGQQRLVAKNGIKIRLNDVLVTGKNGAMGVIFNDGTRISLGPDSRIEITKYLYQPAHEEYGLILKMMYGTAYFISGAIGKAAPESVRFRTPVAIIGTRGTAFLAKVAPKN